MGETTIRFLRVSPRKVRGLKSSGSVKIYSKNRI